MMRLKVAPPSVDTEIPEYWVPEAAARESFIAMATVEPCTQFWFSDCVTCGETSAPVIVSMLFPATSAGAGPADALADPPWARPHAMRSDDACMLVCICSFCAFTL